AAALAQGKADDALELAQDALELEPKNPRALWNKAVAARALGFDAVAAKVFGEIAALGEPGWSTEAAAQHKALEAKWKHTLEMHQRALDAAAVMALDGTPMPDELVRAAPGPARVYLSYALRLAKDAAAVQALMPVAVTIDSLSGGDGAQASVRRAATADFNARAKWRPELRGFFVDFFRSLAEWSIAPDIDEDERGLGEGTPAFITRVVKQQKNEDLVLVLLLAMETSEHFEAFTRAVEGTQDVWFSASLELERGKRELAEGRASEAERLWLEVARAAPAYRRMQAKERLAMLYADEHRAAEAQREASEALLIAREQGDVAVQLRLLWTLGNAARFRNLAALSNAALEERSLWQPSCEARRYLGESSATMDVAMLEPKRARTALELAASCGDPLSIVGAFSFADVMRLDPREGDAAKLTAMLAPLRTDADEAQRVFVDHIEGRALLDVDRAKGEALLRQSIAAAKKLGGVDSMTAKVQAYGYGLLRSDAAHRDDFPALLTLTAEELGRPIPDGCVLVVEVQDDRVAVAGRDRLGAITGAYQRVPLTRRHRQGLEAEEISRVVSPVAERAGEGCELLVYAGYPLHGRGAWLPDELAWSYATGLPKRETLQGRTVVVSDVQTPPELGLKPLGSWSAGVPVDDRITGAQATPERVLSALGDAAFVEFDVHGQVNTGSEDTAALMLANGAHGHSLTAAAVSRAKLNKHPVVLLGACRAATAAPYMHEAWSLPRAFAQAGARSIIAAPVDLPDGEARRFFGPLTERLLRGESPASALRDERVKWLAADAAPWVRQVLVFE
ncbi:MAG: CHAT domain-containing protein, partial [Archangium sp.]